MPEQTLKILKRPDVEKRIGLSRSTIYALLAKGENEFPRPVNLAGGNSVGWYEHEIEAYLASRPRAAYRTIGDAQ
jgi:prophage regulatory protein